MHVQQITFLTLHFSRHSVSDMMAMAKVQAKIDNFRMERTKSLEIHGRLSALEAPYQHHQSYSPNASFGANDLAAW